MDQRNFAFLCYGMICAWLVLFLYVLMLLRRTKKLRDQLIRTEQQTKAETASRL
jgi:hypothetical protein